jgi:uncharacterized protein (DUF2267 family)
MERAMNEPSDGIPVLTDVVTDQSLAATAPADSTLQFLDELEAHLTAVIHEQADELVHNACREMEALLLEQVSDRLKAELPRMIADVISAHFRGTGRPN